MDAPAAALLVTALAACGPGEAGQVETRGGSDHEATGRLETSGTAGAGGTPSRPTAPGSDGPESGDGSHGSTVDEPPADPVGGQRFVDVTQEAGLAAIVQVQARVAPFCLMDRPYTEAPGDFCVAERLMAGVAAGDLDGDTDVDLVFAALDGGTRVMLNDGHGAFEDATAGAGIDPSLRTVAPSIGDFDRDGDLDLYLTSFGALRHLLYINDGHAIFSEEALERGAAVASLGVHLGTTAAMGDADLDGDLDLFVGEWRPDKEMGDEKHHVALLRNLGPHAPGYFEDVTAAAGIDLAAIPRLVDAKPGIYAFAPAFVDLDGDVLPDLAIAGDFGTSRLYWNRGDFTFEDGTAVAGVGTERNGMGSTFADLDDDGDLDWFVSAIYTVEFPSLGNRLYLNRGDRKFDTVTDVWGVRDTGWAWGATAVDHDNDGDYALAITAGWMQEEFDDDRLSLWDLQANPPMVDIAPSLGIDELAQGRGLIDFDHDRDGDLDLLVVHWSTPPRLYRNDDVPGDWLRVRTIGTRGDVQGRGATVEVEFTDGRRRAQQIGAGVHLYGHGEPIAHFGLGVEGEAEVAAVRVFWPVSGATSEVVSPARNALLEVVEPE